MQINIEAEEILTDLGGWLDKGEDTSIFKELSQKSSQASSQTVLDQASIEREEDWSVLAHQVVGRELSQ